MPTTSEVLAKILEPQTVVVMQGEQELARGQFAKDEKTFIVGHKVFKLGDIKQAYDYCDTEWEIHLKPEKVNIHAMSEGEFQDFCQDFEESDDPDSFIDMLM